MISFFKDALLLEKLAVLQWVVVSYTVYALVWFLLPGVEFGRCSIRSVSPSRG